MEGVTRTWAKTGRFGTFSALLLGGRRLQMLCLPGFGTHPNTQNLPHSRAVPASIQEHCPPKCLFFMANAKLPNRPGFALLQGSQKGCVLKMACKNWSENAIEGIGPKIAGGGELGNPKTRRRANREVQTLETPNVLK